MPEEINRLVTDAISDLFFTTSADADENLIQEGVSKDKIHMVGNLMIDSLKYNLEKTNGSEIELVTIDDNKIKKGRDFQSGEYCMMTFHRPSNVDFPENLEKLIHIWGHISQQTKLIFPAHPRTLKNAEKFGLMEKLKSFPNLYLTEPIGYLEFINLLKHSKFVLTDSGGIQEETTFMGVPCLTVRPNTERPITIWEGTNQLLQIDEIVPAVEKILYGKGKKGKCPKFWDGKAASRIAAILQEEKGC
jgi:UDP-N-acetylglucosamine 2-epimerase (non-hydrolysing)